MENKMMNYKSRWSRMENLPVTIGEVVRSILVALDQFLLSQQAGVWQPAGDVKVDDCVIELFVGRRIFLSDVEEAQQLLNDKREVSCELCLNKLMAWLDEIGMTPALSPAFWAVFREVAIVRSMLRSTFFYVHATSRDDSSDELFAKVYSNNDACAEVGDGGL
jgi:hypothetical protein